MVRWSHALVSVSREFNPHLAALSFFDRELSCSKETLNKLALAFTNLKGRWPLTDKPPALAKRSIVGSFDRAAATWRASGATSTAIALLGSYRCSGSAASLARCKAGWQGP
jgi:hypothetical protein